MQTNLLRVDNLSRPGGLTGGVPGQAVGRDIGVNRLHGAASLPSGPRPPFRKGLGRAVAGKASEDIFRSRRGECGIRPEQDARGGVFHDQPRPGFPAHRPADGFGQDDLALCRNGGGGGLKHGHRGSPG